MKNPIVFEKGKKAFQVLLIVLFQWASTTGRLNLYDTDQRFKSDSLQFDCLNYHTRHEILAYQELSDVVDEIIPYCFRPANNFDKPFEASVDSRSQELTFEQLRMGNITAYQLLSWSIPIEVAERYQFYLNEPNSALNEHIYNCTERQFGLQCQYTFEFDEGISFEQIVEADFRGRQAYSESSDMMVQVPCYVLLKCHRDGQPWCLDWREVCDGKVDCFDEKLDEETCFDMEINECSDDEYRCHNGLCISQEFWQDGVGDTECLDRSDGATDFSYIKFCFQDPTFRCEEHSCEVTVSSFSCGDGQCVLKLEKCHNGRHKLLIDSMKAQGNLTDECWAAMVCLTGLVKKMNESICEKWPMNMTAYAALEQCGSLVQFPTIPVYSDHIRFFYKDPYFGLNVGEFLLPDYVCYDQQLCDFVIPRLFHANLTCVEKPDSIRILDISRDPWSQLMFSTERYFRSCSTPHSTFHNKTNFSDRSSLYQCQNSSKFISKHRIMDRLIDCFEEDDEKYQNSCLLNDRYRVKCYDITQCWSPLVKNDVCKLSLYDDFQVISFQSFCDGIPQYFHDNNGQEYSDEFGCGNWSCNNMYARCDGFWACSDGRDEDNCSRTKCPSQTYACISVNYTAICLNSTLVNDGTMHCIGALDEQVACRVANSWTEISRPFHCSKSNQCLQICKLCDTSVDCPQGDDDNEDFCNNQQLTCDQNSTHNRSEVQDVICALNDAENRKIKYFSVYTSSNFPSLENNLAVEFNQSSPERHSTQYGNVSQLQNNVWSWYCHRGLVIYNSTKNNNRTCMCPPSYYGHLCQYQNQRISLTLRLTSNDRHATYAVVSMLIDDNDERQEIDAYEQFLYIAKESCSMKLNRYLLFSTRPKNISKNYSVRIDVFEKNAITYIGSWHFPLAFLFLPVNRLSISLNLSNHQLQHSFNCFNNCNNGECVKYVNKPQYFCRCFSNWSGIQCNIPINCQTCPSNSICIGSTNNRSICVCPMDRFGRQCLLTSTCSINACQNNGQCVPADVSIPGNNYTCICSDQFFGQNCEHRKAKLDVSLNKIDIPPYLVAYFFTLSNKSDPIETTVLRKLTLFQHTVIFHIAVPFQLAFIQASGKYYLAALQQSPKTSISTSISSKQKCSPVEKLLNSTVLKLIPYQRIIHFHYLCQIDHLLTCFIDETYLCLCTNDHHANCMKFNRERNFQCPSNNYCENGGHCLQDHPTCPSTKICLCPNCFLGNRCQFYAKGLGSTLDEILGYEFKQNTRLSEQPITVKVGAAVTIVIFLIGIINSILSIIIFSRKKSQEVGCGIYLLASSITSLLTMILFTLKFWFLFYSHQNIDGQQHIFQGNCFSIEPLLKVFLYLDNWLNACAAIERTISAIQGITFNKNRSKRIAIRVIVFLFVMICCLFIPQLIHLHIFHDETEERSWCVVRYVKLLATYSTALIFIHYFFPLTINIVSMICTIVLAARQKAVIQTNRSFGAHLRLKIRKNKHILISSAIIICLTLPYLIISIRLDCQKSSHLLWFYLVGYFLSFCPAAFIFIIFVLPSPLYRTELTDLLSRIRRRWKYLN